MADLFSGISEQIRKSPFIIPIFIAICAGLAVSIFLFREDLMTSYLGYAELPTKKVYPATLWAVALMPQVFQIILGFGYASNTKKRWMLGLLLIFHFTDVYSDVYYKSNQFQSANLALMAFVESEVLYTLGSEVLLTLCFGLMIENFSFFMVEIVRELRVAADLVGKFIGDSGTQSHSINFDKEMFQRQARQDNNLPRNRGRGK